MKRALQKYLLLAPLTLVSCFGGGGGDYLLPGGGSTTSPSLGALKVTAVSPTTANAGDTLTISGENFPTSGLSIKVGTHDCLNVAVSSSTTATCQVGKTGGTSDIIVSTSDSSDTLPRAFSQSFTLTFLNKSAGASVNYSPTRIAYAHSLLYFQNKLYAAWNETSATVSSIRVAVNDGTDDAPNWVHIDGNGALGLKVDSTKNTSNVRLFSFQDKIHVLFSERNSSNTEALRISRYDGNSSWTALDVGDVGGLNYSTSTHASFPRCLELSAKMYCMWIEASKVRLKAYDGTSWSSVDSGGINRDLARGASTPSMLVFNNKLYVAWTEANSSSVNQVRIRSYDPTQSQWTVLDGGAEAGLNQDATRGTNWAHLVVFKGQLILAWQESNAATSKNNIRVVAYNGNDSNPSFTRIDGGGATGITVDATANSTQPALGVVNSQLMVHYIDSSNFKVRAAVWNGSTTAASWSHVTGSATNVINLNPSNSPNGSNTYSDPASTGNHVYVSWTELSAGGYQLRVLKLE